AGAARPAQRFINVNESLPLATTRRCVSVGADAVLTASSFLKRDFEPGETRGRDRRSLNDLERLTGGRRLSLFLSGRSYDGG
ncbi:MAG: hypothetical protein ACJ8EU_11695, partial [Xanthobacteraceae bacterium]